jgi:hypothetical protein
VDNRKRIIGSGKKVNWKMRGGKVGVDNGREKIVIGNGRSGKWVVHNGKWAKRTA